MNSAVRLLVVVGLLLLINLAGATTAMASWRCEGDLLTVERISGAVDPRGLVQDMPQSAGWNPPWGWDSAPLASVNSAAASHQ